MKSMLNTAGMVRPTETCCEAAEMNTIDYQLQRLAGGVVEGRRLLKIIGSQLFGTINTDECERNKPATVADAMSILADDLVVMGKELAEINEAVSRQLGNWRLE